MKRFGEIILAAPGSVMVIMILLIMMSIYPASNIRTDFNLEGFYPEEDPVIDDYHLLENEFGRDDNLILVGFEAANVVSPEVLIHISELTAAFEQIEDVESVRSITNAEEISNPDDQLTFSPYIPDQIPTDPNKLKALKKALTDDPFLRGILINTEATVTSLIIQIEDEKNTYPNRQSIIRSVHEEIDKYTGQYEFHISGIPYYRNQYVNLLNGEIVVYIVLSSLLIILLLWYIYRTLLSVLFPMIIVWTTLLFTVAIIQLTGGYLEIMSSTIAPILLCVGVADAIHMISKYDDSRQNGVHKRKSILEMLTTLGSATFLTSITTAVGFASLVSSTVVPMAKFGAYTAAGVLLAYVVTIFFLPIALSKSKRSRIFKERSGSFYPIITRLLSKVAAINRLHYKKILWGTLLMTGLILLGISNIDVNGRVFDDLGEDTELMQDSRFFSEHLSPQFPLEFIINTGEPEQALQEDLLNRVDQFEKFLLGFDEIHQVVGLNTLLKEIHTLFRDIENGDQTVRTLPDTDSAISQYVLLLEINNASELERLIDFDYQKLRVTAFTEDVGSKRINEMREEIRNYLEEHFPEAVTVTGTTILSADLTEKIVYSLSWSIIIAVIAISLIMTFLFKNVRMVFISLVPNIIPLLVIAGVMGFMNVDIKPSTAVIFTISLGIAVDDRIHYLARFRIEYLRTGSLNPALSLTTIRTGRAIIVTSLILIAGFSSLVTSAFTSTAMMGFLVCLTIFAALIADLFVLPSLFYWIRPELKLKEFFFHGKISWLS